MEAGKTAIVDFVARGETPDQWRLVLVESGPWDEPESTLRRIQDRLYGCLDAAAEGAVAETFPESLGKHVVIGLDCYDAPEQEISDFFERFADGVLKLPYYQEILAGNRFVSGVSFKISFGTIDEA